VGGDDAPDVVLGAEVARDLLDVEAVGGEAVERGLQLLGDGGRRG
jgi:hypothetical protein